MDRIWRPWSSTRCSLLKTVTHRCVSLLKNITQKDLCSWRWSGIQTAMTNTQRKPHLSTRPTSRMLTTPNTAASRAGAVYMLSCRSITLTVIPFSPIKERHACNANVCEDITIWKHILVTYVASGLKNMRYIRSYLVPGWNPKPDRHSCSP